MKDGRVGAYREALAVVFAAVALLLVIAVANVAGLMLVQLHRRAAELVIRQAIGGSRAQILSAVMREVLCIAGAGLLGGTALSVWLDWILVKTLAQVPRMNELAFDWRALLFDACAIVAAALAFGLWPALVATRRGATTIAAHSGNRVSASHRSQQVLVVAQIALGMLLAASAGLMLRSYYNLTRVDAGFSSEHAITFHVGAEWTEDRTRIRQLQERLVAELRQLPTVVEAGFTNFLPATGATLRYQVTVEGLGAAGDNRASGDDGKLTVGERTISDGYLRALAVPLLAGAWCTPLQEASKAPPTAMVNRAFVDRYGSDVIGRQFAFDQVAGNHTIVGVVGNLIEDGARATPAPYVYDCLRAGAWPDPEYVVRVNGDARAVLASIREVVHRLDASRAIFGVQNLDAVMAAALDQPRLDAGMLTLFAAAAMGLASLGLYSLLMLIVSERTRELGVRMALGAAPLQVVGLIFAGAGRLLAAGIALGLVLVAAMTRLLGAELFGVSPLDTPTLTAAIAAFAAAAMAVAAVPAIRAARIDPIAAIRAD
jgi:predicted permease